MGACGMWRESYGMQHCINCLILVCLCVLLMTSAAPTQSGLSASSRDALKALDAKMASLRAQLSEAREDKSRPSSMESESPMINVVPQAENRVQSKEIDAGQSASAPGVAQQTSMDQLHPKEQPPPKVAIQQAEKSVQNEMQEEVELQSGKTEASSKKNTDNKNFKVLMWGGAAGLGIVALVLFALCSTMSWKCFFGVLSKIGGCFAYCWKMMGRAVQDCMESISKCFQAIWSSLEMCWESLTRMCNCC